MLHLQRQSWGSPSGILSDLFQASAKPEEHLEMISYDMGNLTGESILLIL